MSLKQQFVAKINSGRIYSPVLKVKAEIAVKFEIFLCVQRPITRCI
jgi:hypothetical protein